MQEHPSNEKSVIRPVAMALAVAGLISVSGAAMAQDAKAAAPAASGASAPAAPKDYKDYKEVTKDFKAVDGLFKTHFDAKKNQVMFEIPKALLGEPLLMVQNITAVPPKVDHVGKMANQDVVRFVRQGKRVFLEMPNFDYKRNEGQSLSDAVERAQRSTILASYEVVAENEQGDPVVNVTGLFTSEVGDFSVRPSIRGTGLVTDRSYVKAGKAFPTSVRVDAVQTWALMPPQINPAMLPPGFQMPPMPQRFGTVEVSYSIVALPKDVMRPRLMDDRVGFFGVNRVNFDVKQQGVKEEPIISRWRLEKKDPSAALSEPVKPIVWYLDPATPPAILPYVKSGVEAWNKAFEAAGFKNAVQARTFPSKEEDPAFDPEDVRYSIIRWVPSPVPNAYGPHIADPRSGEILNANIVMYHNIIQLQRDWYVTQAGAVDPRAQQLPLPDDLMGKLVEYVVTHEVGHSLGFPHNMKASSQYPFEKLRDPKWLKEMGHVSTLMDYSRFNYLVQPGDKVDPALLIPGVGPYDVFAAKWGYMPLPQAKTPEEERALLEPLVREQDSKPWLRFSAPQAQGGDYGELTEAVGDADAVSASELGTKNLQRIVKQLPKMVAKLDDADDVLHDLYRAVWNQWGRELGHVVAIVGGYDFHNKHHGQPGAIAKPASRAQQARAVAFLNQHLFQTPEWLNDKAITERFVIGEFQGMTLGTQRAALRLLLERGRIVRLKAQETAGEGSYTANELMQDLRQGIFSEVSAGKPVSTYRRHLQRAYVETLAEKLAVNGASGVDESRGLARQELRGVRAMLQGKSAGAANATQRAHLAELLEIADRALDPRGASMGAPGARGFQEVNALADPAAVSAEEGCWHQLPVQR